MSRTIDGVTTSYVIDPATPLTMVLAETTGIGNIFKSENYAATSPMEDWAESFASTVFPDYYDMERHRIIGPLREQFVLDQIAKLP